MEFEQLLRNIFGSDFIDTLKTKRPAGWVDLMVAFEARKRAASPFKPSPLNISLPFPFIDLYKKQKVRMKSYVNMFVCYLVFYFMVFCIYIMVFYLYHGSLYHDVLYHDVLFQGILYHDILYHGILYHDILHHGISYHGILYHGM